MPGWWIIPLTVWVILLYLSSFCSGAFLLSDGFVIQYKELCFFVFHYKPFLLFIKMHCKTASCLFYLFSPLYILLSLCLLLLGSSSSPAMMAPHLAVGTMRNDKMGEPCFYLMGQNQTTVCSQKSVPTHSPCHLFPFDLIHPTFQLIPTWIPLCVCLRTGVLTVCMLYVVSCLNST